MKLPLYIPATISLILAVFVYPSAHAEEKNPVKDRVNTWVATFNENDPEAMVDFYEDTEDLDMLVSAGLWHRGIGEVRKAYQKDKENWKYHDSNSRNLRIRNLGEVALVSFEHRFKLSSMHEDLGLQIHIRTTMTLRKVGSEWKIVSEHSSAIDGIERVTVIANKGEKTEDVNSGPST
jgi:ketosteroid isomerase-like protein